LGALSARLLLSVYMLSIKQKPYHLLLLTAVALWLFSFFVRDRDNVTDLHFHDTYFIVGHAHIYWLVVLLLLLIWVFYLLVGTILRSKGLAWVHIIVSIFASIFLVFLITGAAGFTGQEPRRYQDFSNWNSLDRYDGHIKWVVITTCMLVGSQLIFVFNIIAGLYARRSSQSN
jgi:heme/copper-type cytochrome/quinol oxidase subunit 1